MSVDRGYRFLEPAALARVKNLALVARGVVEGFISGLHSSPFKGFSVEFAEHRKYTPGDNPRHLDWRILGRTDRLYIKQYEEETNLRAQILLDTSGSMTYGHESGVTKLQYGTFLAAVLAYLMMRQQDSVGLTTFDEQVRLDMPAGGSPRHFDEMMHQLEAIEPGRATDLEATLHRLAERFKRRCLVVLISDLHDDADAMERVLHHFRAKRHEVIVVALLPTGGPPAPQHGRLEHAQEAVRQALAQCRVGAERADLAAKLRQARGLLARADAPRKEIYVLTDNQAISWENLAGDAPESGRAVPVVLVDVHRAAMLNVALRDLRLQSPAPVAGAPIQARVEVRNTAAVAQLKHLELYVDGTRQIVSPTLSLPPGGAVTHEFRFTLETPGSTAGRSAWRRTTARP